MGLTKVDLKELARWLIGRNRRMTSVDGSLVGWSVGCDVGWFEGLQDGAVHSKTDTTMIEMIDSRKVGLIGFIEHVLMLGYPVLLVRLFSCVVWLCADHFFSLFRREWRNFPLVLQWWQSDTVWVCWYVLGDIGTGWNWRLNDEVALTNSLDHPQHTAGLDPPRSQMHSSAGLSLLMRLMILMSSSRYSRVHGLSQRYTVAVHPVHPGNLGFLSWTRGRRTNRWIIRIARWSRKDIRVYGYDTDFNTQKDRWVYWAPLTTNLSVLDKSTVIWLTCLSAIVSCVMTIRTDTFLTSDYIVDLVIVTVDTNGEGFSVSDEGFSKDEIRRILSTTWCWRYSSRLSDDDEGQRTMKSE